MADQPLQTTDRDQHDQLDAPEPIDVDGVARRRDDGFEPTNAEPTGENVELTRYKPPVERTKWGAYVGGWFATRGELHVDEYLTSRLRQYEVHRPPVEHPPPYEFAISDGRIVQRPVDEKHPMEELLDELGDDRGSARRYLGVEAKNRQEAEVMREELDETREEFEEVDERLDQKREEREDAEAEMREKIDRGRAACSGTEARDDLDAGVPDLNFPWWQVLGYAFIVVAVLGEAWLFAQSFWMTTGVDPANLGRAWEHQPHSVLSGLGFAVAATGTLFVLWKTILEGCRALFGEPSEDESTWERLKRPAAGLAMFGLILGVSWGVAAMRHGTAEAAAKLQQAVSGGAAAAGSGNQMLFMLLTLTVPLAAGLVELIVNRREETREAIREELRDRESARDELLETRERQAEVLGQLEDEEQRLESERSALKAKIRQLDEYAIEVEREIRERIEQERKLMHAYCRAVSGALARDRAAFLYHADEELLEPREDGSSDGAAALGTHLPDEGRARVEDAAAE